ncbi:unnamed protein product [Natator depressus]
MAPLWLRAQRTADDPAVGRQVSGFLLLLPNMSDRLFPGLVSQTLFSITTCQSLGALLSLPDRVSTAASGSSLPDPALSPGHRLLHTWDLRAGSLGDLPSLASDGVLAHPTRDPRAFPLPIQHHDDILAASGHY